MADHPLGAAPEVPGTDLRATAATTAPNIVRWSAAFTGGLWALLSERTAPWIAAAIVAAIMLEPQSDDGLTTWNAFDPQLTAYEALRYARENEFRAQAFYSQAAADAGEGGTVMLNVLVGLDGQAEEVLFVPEKSTVAEDSDIARNTLKVAADWKFQPGVEDGKPVRRRVLVPVRFEPPAKAAAPEA